MVVVNSGIITSFIKSIVHVDTYLHCASWILIMIETVGNNVITTFFRSSASCLYLCRFPPPSFSQISLPCNRESRCGIATEAPSRVHHSPHNCWDVGALCWLIIWKLPQLGQNRQVFTRTWITVVVEVCWTKRTSPLATVPPWLQIKEPFFKELV